ncbi:hypothetical protein DFH28DRAFT_958230 [Melampsora americana]|nr:hypothetical protein DFH28DRAFT_958230 [Melampsora americana]
MMISFKVLKFTFGFFIFSSVINSDLIKDQNGKRNDQYTLNKSKQVTCIKLQGLGTFTDPEFPGEEALVRQREKIIHRTSKIGVMIPFCTSSSSSKDKMIIKKKKKFTLKDHESRKNPLNPRNVLKEEIVLSKSKLNPNIVLS